MSPEEYMHVYQIRKLRKFKNIRKMESIKVDKLCEN